MCGGTLPFFIRKLISFLSCRMQHGASLDNFCSLEMYKYTNAERKRVYTFCRQKRISDKFNEKPRIVIATFSLIKICSIGNLALLFAGTGMIKGQMEKKNLSDFYPIINDF